MKRRSGRDDWVSLVPNGIGQIKPNHYLEIARAVWRNRDELPFAWRILTRGVCDGCALGTSGVRDFTMDGVHLCLVRLDLLRMNTMAALDPRLLEDAAPLAEMSGAELRGLGRLPFPMLRRRGERGFTRINWEEALSLIGERIRRIDPSRLGFYMTSRGLTNETYYAVQKVARFLGTNNVDNSARICHSPSTVAMKETLGISASTCSYTDWIGSDLLVFFGSNTPNNQPVTMKYIYHARKKGARVVVVNPYREPGLERYWVPSVAESALFGTKMTDEFYQVNTGGDRAFIAGTLKHLVERGWTDSGFIARHTVGFDAMVESLAALSWEHIENRSGATVEQMLSFAERLKQARSAIFVWSMGITQHRFGVDNVRAIVNLALARGFVGREKCGLVPIRGHSGVQGGAEVGAVPNQLPGGFDFSQKSIERFREIWDFDVPTAPGLNAVQMIDSAHSGALDLLYQIGGNFLETLPDPNYVAEAVRTIPFRVHQDIVLSPQMFVEPENWVVLLPAQTRYEQAGGGTETSTERRIIFSPEIPGRRIGETRPEWAIPIQVAERAFPERAHQISFPDGQAIRNEIAVAVPMYEGIQHLRRQGDQVQWGGERLCEFEDDSGARVIRFNLPDGRARFSPITHGEETVDRGLLLSTRRGRQFNSMVHGERDSLTGARRHDVLMSPADAEALGLKDGDAIRVRSEAGTMRGTCLIGPIAPGNVQVHWPEGNVLIRRGVTDDRSGMVDYNTVVEIESPDID